MSDLRGKVAIVTGASTPLGIGRAIALRFAQAGAGVLLVADGTHEQLEDARKQCASVPGAGTIQTAQLDLGLSGAPEEMVAIAEREFGRVDVLVNNAGIRASENFGDFTRERFDRTVAVNLASAFFASQAVLPMMRRQQGGRILHIGSQMGRVTSAQRALYGATKAALIHLTRSMAVELGKENIIVNSISPGPVATQPLLDRGPEATAKLVAKIPLGRLGQPTEIADVALYLAASSPAFLLGQDIVVDGGYVIQ